jgi:hypothetical protein
MKRILVLSALLLASCATKPIVDPFTTPDGKPAFIAYCGSDVLTMTDCYNAARTQCGGDYKVLMQSETERPLGDGQSRRMEFICST